jgi:hypothetical protein
MAKIYSEDPGSGPLGGNLGYSKRGAMVPAYEATALKLKAGEISQVIESEFGFHIIQLIDRRGNDYNSRHILIRPSYSEVDLTEAQITWTACVHGFCAIVFLLLKLLRNILKIKLPLPAEACSWTPTATVPKYLLKTWTLSCI